MPSIDNSSHDVRPGQTATSRRRGPEAAHEDVAHRLKVGDAVTVFALNFLGPFIVGTGTIVSYCPADDIYWIKFEGDPVRRRNFVSPDWQATPERSLALLRAFWNSGYRDDPVIEDFFPDIDSAL